LELIDREGLEQCPERVYVGVDLLTRMPLYIL
jgi:hypothetical protein